MAGIFRADRVAQVIDKFLLRRCLFRLIRGLRVVLVKLDLAIVHACVAQAFFCLTAFMAVVTSRRWNEAPDVSNSFPVGNGRGMMWLGVITVAVTTPSLRFVEISRASGACSTACSATRG